MILQQLWVTMGGNFLPPQLTIQSPAEGPWIGLAWPNWPSFAGYLWYKFTCMAFVTLP